MIKFFATYSGKVFINVFVSVGASVVILGALGKILHASWGTLAITAGMLTECLIFLILAFVPVDHHPHWDRYFPDIYSDPTKEKKKNKGQLAFQKVNFLGGGSAPTAEVVTPATPEATSTARSSSGNPALDKLDDMLQEADITPKNLKKLADNFAKLNATVGQVADLSHVNMSVQDLAVHTKDANEALGHLKDVYVHAAKQFNANGFTEGVKNFYEQMQGITKNISSLNAIYGVEIKDTLEDIKKVRKYFNGIDAVTAQLSESVEEVKMTKQQMGLLIKNLSHLNSIYGNMLGAMQAPVRN